MELTRKRKSFYIMGFLLILLVLVFPVILFGQVCGDGTVTPPEQCDDGNSTSGDGCDASCLLEYVPLVNDLPGVTYSGGSVGVYLEEIFRFFLGLTALFAVVAISYGGIQYITTDAIQGKSDGKAKITRALLGFLLALIAYIILYTINPDLISFNFDPAGSASSTSTSPGGGP